MLFSFVAQSISMYCYLKLFVFLFQSHLKTACFFSFSILLIFDLFKPRLFFFLNSFLLISSLIIEKYKIFNKTKIKTNVVLNFFFQFTIYYILLNKDMIIDAVYKEPKIHKKHCANIFINNFSNFWHFLKQLVSKRLRLKQFLI